MKRIILLLGVTFFSLSNYAAESDDYKIEYMGELGSLLPDQIDGVAEILPMWGAAIGVNKGLTTYSLGTSIANAEGVTLYNSFLEARTEIPFSGLIGIVGAGIDLNVLKRPGDDEFTYYGGGHVGGGVLALISHGLYARMNMKFVVSPGVSLFLGFGLVYRPSEDL